MPRDVPKFAYAIILDFEATCDDGPPPAPQEIIEFPSVLLSLETLEVLDEFESFVRPEHHPLLTEFCKSLTSIQQADVNAAESFPTVFENYQDWLQSHGLDETNSLFVTCGDWDLQTMLPGQCAHARPRVEMVPPLFTLWQNIKKTYAAVHTVNKAPGLSGMLRTMELELQGHHHRGIDDCRNIATLYKALLAKGAVPEPTTELPPSKFPPITLTLCASEQSVEAELAVRNLRALFGIASRTFKQQFASAHRQDGALITGDDDLRFLSSGEVIRFD